MLKVVRGVKGKVTTVAEYIAAAPKEKRAALAQLRKTIRAAAPKATEEIRYGMAGYMQDGKPLIHFAYWKDHYALYGGFGALARELKGSTRAAKERCGSRRTSLSPTGSSRRW